MNTQWGFFSIQYRALNKGEKAHSFYSCFSLGEAFCIELKNTVVDDLNCWSPPHAVAWLRRTLKDFPLAVHPSVSQNPSSCMHSLYAQDGKIHPHVHLVHVKTRSQFPRNANDKEADVGQLTRSSFGKKERTRGNTGAFLLAYWKETLSCSSRPPSLFRSQYK